MPKLGLLCCLLWGSAEAYTGTLQGVVTDPTGAPLQSATVELTLTGFARRTVTGADGSFVIPDLPGGAYRLSIALAGFETHRSGLAIRTPAPVEVSIQLAVAGQRTSITVEGSRPEAPSVAVGRRLLAGLPAAAPDSGLNDAIMMTTPGVAADSNGFFHPLGDHAQVSYILDGQPISDQRNKVFSTSIPANAIQSMEVISGLPSAEYGDKTSLVVNATTRSGLGQKPSGSLVTGYGSFGSLGEEATLGAGSPHWGSFLIVNTERTGRFLDTPEFRPLHDVGNTETLFDRIDYQPGAGNSLHLNLLASRNWFQVPNTYDQSPQDQRQKVVSFNIAPGYQRAIDARTLLSLNLFFRRDQVDYYPSRDPRDDLPVSFSQSRSLANYGLHTDLSRAQGRHNWKAGLNVAQTRLDEAFTLGALQFQGKANINQAAFFAQDSVSLGALTLNIGLRFDRYDGLTNGSDVQPRGGFSYLFKPTGTVIRGGYSRTLETPTTENLVASSSLNLLAGVAEQRPIGLGRRNQYDAGIQQPLGRWVLLDVSYFRKYTRNAFDFDALFSAPITFPIAWYQSKLDGVAARISTVDIHGWRAYGTMGHANARFFGPETGGIIFNSNLSVGAYRQDHDQVYQQNVNIHYQKPKSSWWADFTWRYDSGLAVGAVNSLDDALALTADQQSVIGFYCGVQRASLTNRIGACGSPRYGAERIKILAPGAENDDHNPPRTTPRHVFHLGAGSDNLLHTEHVRMIVRFTALNLSNTASLYNFLSPFSGTHWVEPRTYRAQIGWAF